MGLDKIKTSGTGIAPGSTYGVCTMKVYLESTVRTDLARYDSLWLRIKGFKRNPRDPECTSIVVRHWKLIGEIAIYPGIKIFNKLTEYSPKQLLWGDCDPEEIVNMGKQVIATRDYSLLGLMMDRAIELDLIPSHPYWFRQWKGLVDTKCNARTEYNERFRVGYNGAVHKLPDIAVVSPNQPFFDTWAELEEDGCMDAMTEGIFRLILERWVEAGRPDNIQRFILRNYY